MSKASAAAPGGAERRRSERAEFVVRVNYKTVDEIFSEFARNVNEGGIFIETESPQAIGSPIFLEFSLPGAESPLQVHGTVVWVSDGADGMPGMGIEFGELGDEARSRINDLVRSLRTGPKA